MEAVVAIAVVVVLLWLMVRSEDRRRARRRSAPVGAVHVETDVRAHQINRLVEQYAADGWAMVEQSSAKSFGRSAKLAVTFRKERPGTTESPPT